MYVIAYCTIQPPGPRNAPILIPRLRFEDAWKTIKYAVFTDFHKSLFCHQQKLFDSGESTMIPTRFLLTFIFSALWYTEVSAGEGHGLTGVRGGDGGGEWRWRVLVRDMKW